MNRLLSLAGVLCVALSLTPASAFAQEPDSTRLSDLEARVEALTRELERVNLGDEVVRADTSIGGFGLGASKVYQVERGVSLGGYGEVLYENYASELEDGSPASKSDQFDALRAIIYIGYKFNDRLLFNSEIEIEHGNEAFLEFGYLDYLLNENVGVRGGLLLAPLGFLNELHEPPIFLGTERPVTEQRIIPSTWRENGIGLFGSTEDFNWRVYVMNSLDGAGFDDDGFRGGRQKGSKALAEDLGVAGRFDYVGKPGLILGASGYMGETAQNRELEGETIDGRIFIWDAHVDYKVRGWELRGLVAGATVDDPISLNELNGLTGADGVGEQMLDTNRPARVHGPVHGRCAVGADAPCRQLGRPAVLMSQQAGEQIAREIVVLIEQAGHERFAQRGGNPAQQSAGDHHARLRDQVALRRPVQRMGGVTVLQRRQE